MELKAFYVNCLISQECVIPRPYIVGFTGSIRTVLSDFMSNLPSTCNVNG